MSFAENYQQIRSRIEAACSRGNRPLSGVLLLPVSKGQPVELIREAADAGLQIFGESKVQEAKVKIPQAPSRLQWHMIGHLQSNKCRDAIHLFTNLLRCIRTLCSLNHHLTHRHSNSICERAQIRGDAQLQSPGRARR